MSSQQSTSIPPDLIKKVEKEILSEAKNEEKNLKKAIKDLTQTEKRENYAHKTLTKADNDLEKAEKKEQGTLKAVYKAEHKHDVAVSEVKTAQQELEASMQGYGKMKETLKKKAARVDEEMKAHEEHTQLRNSKLNALRGPSAPNEAARVVAEVTHQPPNNDIDAQSKSQYLPNNV